MLSAAFVIRVFPFLPGSNLSAATLRILPKVHNIISDFFYPSELQPHHQLQPVGYLYLHVKLHRQLNHVAQFSPLGKKV